MDALERYVNDCENKRRRMRDRPSDLVVSQLRWLLDHLKSGPRDSPEPEPERVDPPARRDVEAT